MRSRRLDSVNRFSRQRPGLAAAFNAVGRIVADDDLE
jgi:hypothetical protein